MCSQVDSNETARAAQATDGLDGEVAAGDAARIAALFRVLADPSRCRLVYALLRGDEICVGELAERLGMSESNVSHHLSVLRAHGLVRFRREGKQVFYAPDDDHIRLLLDMTLEHVRHGDEPAGPGAGRPTTAAQGDANRP
jgi:ArsR family transcriptional regulator, lead/cadmium/zinc/bismuth-responsive transcriptional repressor